ncbi:hypothetical protein [Emticicia sp. TH156]|uniref:hypothetical protein n=1 Tax=Emticicia sp. TH156 TaxID=2067454 RepID=UPI000C782F1B|nr:hypothetical protein [Emticicia sp. TH156]PLK44017.1 hypothetical protein C0V77_12760 [Emticicia sp. TH156]
MKLTIHNGANADTLSFARIWIFFIWFIWVSTDSSYLVANAEYSIFFKHGLMNMLSDDFLRAISPGVMLTVKCVTLYFIVAVIFGINRSKWNIFIAAVLLTFYMGYIRGWGNHVNHRELTLLYCTYLLLLLPCYDTKNGKSDKPQSVYQAGMLALGIIITFDYAVIGIARVAKGFPITFHPDIMRQWLVFHAYNPSEWGFEYGKMVLDYPWLNYLVAPMLPVSTVLEIIAPFALFASNKLRLGFVVLLFLFHLGIYLLMNILFLENMLLLFLLLDYTSMIENLRSKVAGAKSGFEKLINRIAQNG